MWLLHYITFSIAMTHDDLCCNSLKMLAPQWTLGWRENAGEAWCCAQGQWERPPMLLDPPVQAIQQFACSTLPACQLKCPTEDVHTGRILLFTAVDNSSENITRARTLFMMSKTTWASLRTCNSLIAPIRRSQCGGTARRDRHVFTSNARTRAYLLVKRRADIPQWCKPPKVRTVASGVPRDSRGAPRPQHRWGEAPRLRIQRLCRPASARRQAPWRPLLARCLLPRHGLPVCSLPAGTPLWLALWLAARLSRLLSRRWLVLGRWSFSRTCCSAVGSICVCRARWLGFCTTEACIVTRGRFHWCTVCGNIQVSCQLSIACRLLKCFSIACPALP